MGILGAQGRDTTYTGGPRDTGGTRSPRHMKVTGSSRGTRNTGSTGGTGYRAMVPLLHHAISRRY